MPLSEIEVCKACKEAQGAAMSTNEDLAQAISIARAKILTFSPEVQAVCVPLVDALVQATRAADSWSEECATLMEELSSALRGSDADLRSKVRSTLDGAHLRAITKIRALGGFEDS